MKTTHCTEQSPSSVKMKVKQADTDGTSWEKKEWKKALDRDIL